MSPCAPTFHAPNSDLRSANQVCGLNPQGNAFRDGRIKVGDTILEVNGHVIHGR